jgi:hypothetical protein
LWDIGLDVKEGGAVQYVHILNGEKISFDADEFYY